MALYSVGGNATPIDRDWVRAAGPMNNGVVEVRPLALCRWYDAIEIWRCEPNTEDDEQPDGILAVHWYPITRGDVRCLCAALGVPCNA